MEYVDTHFQALKEKLQLNEKKLVQVTGLINLYNKGVRGTSHLRTSREQRDSEDSGEQSQDDVQSVHPAESLQADL